MGFEDLDASFRMCRCFFCSKIALGGLVGRRRRDEQERLGGALFGGDRSGNGDTASLSFTAATPGHLLQRFQKVDKLPVRQRPKDPGVMGANKAPAIRDKAVHRLSDTRMKVSAGVNAIVFGKTGGIPDL
jgi:hypothetical protein